MSVEIKSTAGLEWMCKGVILTALSPAVDFGYKKNHVLNCSLKSFIFVILYTVYIFICSEKAPRKKTNNKKQQILTKQTI